MAKDISRQTVGLSTSLRDAMQAIETSATKIALVVDDAGVLQRTVTDGDIRRGLLHGASLTTPVESLGGQPAITCRMDTSTIEVSALLDAHGITAVVMVDERGVPLEIIDRAAANGMTLMSPPHIGSQEMEFVRAAFEDNWIAPAGPNLTRFEDRLARVSARNHALALSSGTAALHLALRCVRVKAGDRVYVSDLTFAASLQPVLYERAAPVLIDSEPDSWNMSPQALERRLEADAARGALPRAIVLVHIYGQPAQVGPILALADRYGVPVIEDAAESLGATYANRPSGAHGVLSAFSFNGNKIITTSGGGALVGDDEAMLELARYLSTQGRDSYEHYQHATVAYNYRMSNVLAGIGLGQLRLLEERVSARRAIFDRYKIGLGELPGVSFQQEAPGSRGNRWLTVVAFDPNRVGVHPFSIMRELRQSGIEARPGWKPMHMQPICAGCDFVTHDGKDSVSSRLFFQSLCLPSGSSLQPDEQDRIIGLIRGLVGGA